MAKTNTSTQIRSLYSDGMSCLNISFYNTNLSFRFYPFVSKDATGKSSYDLQHGVNTTVNFEGAYALASVADDIIDGKVMETSTEIPCAAGASLRLERRQAMDGPMETIFTITKNGQMIPFRFSTMQQQIKVNGQIQTKIIETGLGALRKTIEGYLTGINAERHLNKLTDDFAKSQEDSQQSSGGYQSYSQGGYQKNNGGFKRYNNNGGYKKQYNNNQQFSGGNGYGQAPNQQNISTYQLQN